MHRESVLSKTLRYQKLSALLRKIVKLKVQASSVVMGFEKLDFGTCFIIVLDFDPSTFDLVGTCFDALVLC